jgi:putative nucleotidyltransferase with HDIG domain
VGHSVRVALLALVVGRSLGLDPRLLVEIGTAGLLHDVGKSKIPHEVLFKPGRLDADERRVISTHTTLGAKILLATADAPPLGIAAAFGHHLRHDRRGYPRLAPWGASGRVTALVQVCDVFEALTAVRPYKPSLTPLRAYEIMAGDKGAFDPSALAAFVRAVGFFPPGSRVRLRSGEQAFVLRVGVDPSKPVVELTHDAGGAPLANADRLVVDLDGEAPGAPREIDDVIMDDVDPAAVSAEEITAAPTGDPHAHEHCEKPAVPEAGPPAAPTCCHAAGKSAG